MRRSRRRAGKRSQLTLVCLCLAGLLVGSGCGGSDEAPLLPPPASGIRILEPAAARVVATHSVRFSVSLDPDLDASRLQMTLNDRDVSAHLRIQGSEAEGYVGGLTDGDNVLRFTAPGVSGGMDAAQVTFRFAPLDMEDVEAKATYQLPGLSGPVDVIVDPWGVHHIYTRGDNPDDLFYAQGYFAARHRLFQMDFFRKVAQGRLTELLGTTLDRSVLETDLFLRTLFLTFEGGQVRHIYDVLAEDLQTRNPALYHILARFADGVNAYIDDLQNGRNGAVLPQQHGFLNFVFLLLGGEPYEIEPLTVAQMLAIGRVQQYDLSSTLTEEIGRKATWEAVEQAEQAAQIPAGTRADLFRSAPPDGTTVLKPGEPHYVGPSAATATVARAVGAAGAAGEGGGPAHAEALRRMLARFERVRRIAWGGLERPFSNNWILAPEMTASGIAILSNDPHLGLSNPSIFYPIHCDNKTFSGGSYNFTGSTFPGVPGILLGQNERLAWGGTVTNYDVTDVYEETVQVNGDEKTVLFNGENVPVQTIQETFRIRGGDAELGDEAVISIDYVPHHGPQVPGDPFSADPGLTAENNMTVAWTGHFLTRDFDAFVGLLDAADIDGFFQVLENFGVGAQNFVGADVEGEIGYFPMALIPVRSAAGLTAEHPPYLPYPGTGGYEWQQDEQGRPRFLAPSEVPQARNPERGWLVTANNDINGSTLDNDPLNESPYLYYTANPGFRNGRITDLLLGFDTEERGVEAMKVIQSDHLSLVAERLRPFFLEALSNEDVLADYPTDTRERLQAAVDRIRDWDLRCRTGLPDHFSGEEPTAEDVASSIGSSLFFVWLNRATQAAFDDEMAAASAGIGSTDRVVAILHILEHVDLPEEDPGFVHTRGPDGQSRLWDDVSTPEVETRDQIMVQAMVTALEDLDGLMGTTSMDAWRWGKIHRITFELEGLGSVIPFFNLPPSPGGYPRQGGWQTVDPAGYSLGGLDFNTDHGPAMRMVVELEEGVMRAYNVLPGGVNDLVPDFRLTRPPGVRSDIHYGDQIPLWLSNTYRPQPIFWEDVTQLAESRIRLEPEE